MKVKQSAGLAIIYDGKVLLAHTTGRGWWGSYGIPKGGIDLGESKIDAAIRETYEELGIKVPRKLIDKTEHTYNLTSRKGTANKTVYWFTVEVDDLKQIGLKDLKVPKSQLQLEEVDWAGFISYDEAMKRTMKSQLNVINNLRGAGLLENRVPDDNKYNKSTKKMKYIKLFEEYTASLNEANEEILAQGACKNAIFMAQKKVEALLKKLLNAGYILKYKTKIKTYNSGYELESKVEALPWREVETLDVPEEIKERLWNVFSAANGLHLYPDSFFESNLEDQGYAIITGKTLDVKKDATYEEKYPRFKVTSKKDIKKVAKQYVDIIDDQIAYLEKELGL